MNLIQCAFDCKYQKDGYCSLETVGPVNSINNSCPHYAPNSTDKIKHFADTLNTDKF